MRRLKQDCAVRDSRCGPGGLRPPPDGNRRNAAMQQEERRRYLIGTLFAALTQMKKSNFETKYRNQTGGSGGACMV